MIQHCGWFIRPGTAAEDTNYGIDGHVNINGHFYPAQIKRRTGGSDIGYMVGIDERPGQRPDQSPNPMDLLKSPSGRDKTMEARDMKSKAIYLFVVAGTQIMRVLAEEGKQLIRNSIAKWIGAIRQYPTRFSDGNVSLSLQWDNRDHYWKIMAYVRPQAFSSMQTCTIPNAATVNYPRHKGEGL